MFHATQETVIGCQIFRVLANRTFDLGVFNPPHEGRNDGSRDLVLELEQLVDAPVIAFAPQMIACRGVYELRRDAEAIPHLSNTAFGYVTHAKLFTDPAYVDSPVAILK